MPKTKKTTRMARNTRSTRTKTLLTEPLYNYVAPVNGKWVRTQADKQGISYSKFVNNLIEFGRRKKFTPAVKGMQRAA